MGEADRNVVAEGDLIGRAQNFTGGVVGDGVSALEELERAALFEPKRCLLDCAAARDQRAIDLDAQVARALVERAAQLADASAKVERGESQPSSGEAALLSSGDAFERGAQSFLLLMNAAAQHGGARAQIERRDSGASARGPLARCGQPTAKNHGERGPKLVQLLPATADQQVHLAETAMRLKVADAVATLRKQVAHLLDQIALMVGDVAVEFLARPDNDFRRGGGSGRAQVGHKIGDGEIGFVSHAGDHRYGGSGNRAGNNFFVECPEIFKRATAAGEDHNVSEFGAIEVAQARDNFSGRPFALYFYGKELHVDIREAALEDAENVLNRRSRGRSDDADAARQNGQRFFARFIKEAFFLQLFFELLEGELERAESDRLDVRDVNLIFATQFVDAERAAHGDVQAIFGAKLESAGLVAKADAADLRARIFQSEVEMTHLRRAVIRNFAFDPDVAEGAFEKVADAFGELADFPHATLRH